MHNVPMGPPPLALDMYEHSYHLDYGAAREVRRGVHGERCLGRSQPPRRGCARRASYV